MCEDKWIRTLTKGDFAEDSVFVKWNRESEHEDGFDTQFAAQFEIVASDCCPDCR